MPFSYWKKQEAAGGGGGGSHPCSSISGTQTFTVSTTIDDAAITSYQCQNWVVEDGVILTFTTNSEAPIGSLTLNGTAQITHTGCTSTQCYQININAKTDVTVGASAQISAQAKGYLGGWSGDNSGTAVGRTLGNTTVGGSQGANGTVSAAGGSFGGYGGYGSTTSATVPNTPYGDITQPNDHGSGGGGGGTSTHKGGSGGGIIRLKVGGILSVEGLITANGSAGTSAGAGGSGGSIWVTAGTLSTSTAGIRFSANGGTASTTSIGRGSGGRIAIEYGTLSGFTISTTYMTAFGITATNVNARSHAGTIYAKEDGQSAVLLIDNNAIAPSTAYEIPLAQALTLKSLTVSGNAIVKQTSSANAIAVENSITVTSPAVLKVPNNGTVDNTGPWTWLTYGSLSGTITEY